MPDIEKKDIHHTEKRFNAALQNLENDSVIIKQNRQLILRFIRDCRLGKTLKNRQKKSIGAARCLKYIYTLKRLSLWLNRPFDHVTQNDMENFIENLENDRYKSEIKEGQILRTKNLASSTKLDYKKTIKKFYKWLMGDNVRYPELVDWIDTFEVSKEIPSLRREEVEKLADASKVRDKAIIMFLFDSGARAEEFLNIKICDLTKVDDTFKVRIAFSKTERRTIHLPICSKYVDIWLQECNGDDDQNYLFPISYEGLRRMLHRAGKKVLNKRVTPHLLRHTSVTYYANLLKNPYKLNYRYGWSMSSEMSKRYIDREGILEEETPDIVKVNDLSRLEKQNQALKEKVSMVNDSNSELSIQLDKIKGELYQAHRGKGFMKTLLTLAENQREMSKAIENLTGKKFDIVLPSLKL